MKATIKLLDEVNCVAIGLLPDHIMALYEDFGRNSPNFFFNPKFKIGAWDGKIRYFHKNGRTYTYLLDEIIPKLVSFGYKIEIQDERTSAIFKPPFITSTYFSHINYPETNKPIELRPYQVDAVNSIIEPGNGIIIGGTGSGKTLMTAALADSYGKLNLKTLTIVPSQDLIMQTKNWFRVCGLDVGEYSGDDKDYKHTHIVSTWQALKNNPIIMKEFNIVIVDECLDENTKIAMSDGTTKNIKDINVGEYVISYNETASRFEPNKVLKQYKNLGVSSSEQMYALEFDTGIVLQITGNHKILTTNGYVRADEITENDEIISIFGGKT